MNIRHCRELPALPEDLWFGLLKIKKRDWKQFLMKSTYEPGMKDSRLSVIKPMTGSKLFWKLSTERFMTRILRQSLSNIMTALSPILFDQMDIQDPHTAIDGLAHIIDRQERCADAGQRFHFHACAPGSLDRASHLDQAVIRIRLKRDAGARKGEQMTHRDQL